MDYKTEQKLRFSYNDKLFDLLKFNEFLADKKFIRRLATNKSQMLFGYLKDIRFYWKFINECEKRYPSFDIENIRKNCIIVEDFSNAKLYISIKDKYDIKTLEEIKNMHFDVAIMNPPYDGNLHLKILECVIPNADKVVNISPVRWLQDPLGKLKKHSDFLDFEESISKKIDDIYFISNEISNKLFSISFGDLGIYTISKGGFNYNFAQDNPLVLKFVAKIKTSFMDVATKEGYKGKYTSKYFGIINSHYGDSSRWIAPKFDLFTTKRETNTNKVLFFNSKNEIKNCFDFLNLKSMLFFARIIRLNQRVPWQYVPYLDYTKPWTNERFCKYFGITGYISDTEAVPGSEWETILKTMEDYE